MLIKRSRRNGTATHIQLVSNLKSAASNSFNFLGAEFRDDRAPLADGGGADAQRPRDIRGSLKVINNVLLEHEPSLTIVHGRMQPQFQPRLLTSVHMNPVTTPAERLIDAMGSAITASELARACHVTPTAVGKWLRGGKMSADHLADAAKVLRVREEWLRTGKLPRERQHGEQERQIDEAMELLQELHGPITALAAALDKLATIRPTVKKSGAR